MATCFIGTAMAQGLDHPLERNVVDCPWPGPSRLLQ